jgi:chromosome segregation ATPase
MENLRRKNQTEILEIKSPFSQTKTQWKTTSTDRISELKDKIHAKEKTEVLLVKQLKSYERNMQELSDSSWALKKEKRYKPKGYVTYSMK